MIEIRPRQPGVPIPWLEASVQTLISNQDTGQRVALQQWSLAAGSRTTTRCHAFEREHVYVVNGECTFRVGESTLSGRRGDLLVVPAGLPRQYENTGKEAAELFVFWTPGHVQDAYQPSADEARREALGVALMETFEAGYRPTGWAASESAIFRPSGSCRGYSTAGDHYSILVDGDDSRQGLALIEALVPPGGGPIPHIHLRDFEAFLVFEGQLSLYADGKLASAGPGDSVILPTGLPHAFRNRTSEPVRMLIVTAPAGFDRMISLVGRLSDRPQPPDPSELKRLKEVAGQFGLVLRPDLEERFTAPG